MPSDEDIARRALDLQRRARDYPLVVVPGYSEWSERKLAEGGNEAFIANLDATSMWLLPEELDSVSTEIFDELLDDLKSGIDNAD